MTPDRITKLKIQAEKDAAELRLLLLTAVGAVWDSAQGVWRVNGRRVSIDSIRSYLLRIETQMSRRIIKLIDALESEQITLAAWQREFDRTISSSHILAGALAVGGIAVSVASSFVIDRIAGELDFADKFVTDIRNKKAGSFSRIKARAKSYMQAGMITYSQINQEARAVIGIQKEARRLLGPADVHCFGKRVGNKIVDKKEGCLYWHGKWVPIRDLPPIGTLICQRHCRCWVEYR